MIVGLEKEFSVFFRVDILHRFYCIAEPSGSVGRALRLGIEGLLIPDSLPVESLCCGFKQDTLSAA